MGRPRRAIQRVRTNTVEQTAHQREGLRHPRARRERAACSLSSPQIVPRCGGFREAVSTLASHPKRRCYESSKKRRASRSKIPYCCTSRAIFDDVPTGTVSTRYEFFYTVSLDGGVLRDEVIGTTDQVHWFKLDELDSVNVAEYAARAIQLALEK